MTESERLEKRVPYPDHTDEELRHLRRLAELCEDWEEARRMTEALAARGVQGTTPVESEGPGPWSQRNAKLTFSAVRAIRASKERSSVLARAFGVTRSTIFNVRSGRLYKEVS